MSAGAREVQPELDALAAVARVARVLVGSGGLSELSNDAMVEIRSALKIDVAALYLTDTSVPGVLRCVGKWAVEDSDVDVTQTIFLDPEAWRFVAVSGGPLVFRERTGWVMENPFRPGVDNWIVLPLVSEKRILGAVVGCSPEPISLGPAAVARFTVIADLLSAGAANAMLRAEVQRTELERERMRLADEIHDSLAQDLAAAVRELALLETQPPPDVVLASEERLRQAVRAAHTVVRRHLESLVGDVTTPGLRAGVDEICARFRARGLTVTMVDRVPDCVVDGSRVVVVLRVLNEALANVQRHAGVAEAVVSLKCERDTLHLSVSDAGRGFDAGANFEVDGGHFGLTIMWERARAAGGTLLVRSRPQHGTTIELSLPAEPSSRQAIPPGDR